MLEGYRDFTLETSIFGGKSLVATKGKQQTRLGLSREFSVIDVSTKVDQNGDGVFDRSEKPSEEVREQVEKGIKMVKSHHDSGRKERQKERQNSANEHGGFAYSKNLSGSNDDTETGHKTPSHSNRYGYGGSGKPERRTDGDGKKRKAIKVVSLSSVSLPVNRQTRPILGQNPTVRLVKILKKPATGITTIVGYIGLGIDLAE